MIILITGSSASGKTTIGNVFAEKYAFQHIDGDQVIKDLGLTSKAWNSIHDEIFKRSLTQHSLGNVVISHVVLPETFSMYQDAFDTNKIDFQIVVLRPSRETLHSRSKTRTCHPKPTPRKYIDYFYTQFLTFHSKTTNWTMIDNSYQTEQETVMEIAKQCDLKI